MTAADLVKLTICLTEEIPGEERRALIHAAIGNELPAATLVYVSRLATPHLKAEVDALASSESAD
jgi:enamine deaminase RidA (YjgF/YER057c/UK114 family)